MTAAPKPRCNDGTFAHHWMLEGTDPAALGHCQYCDAMFWFTPRVLPRPTEAPAAILA
jgi:hypothetical protein